MDPAPVFFEDCVPHCSAMHPYSGARCVLFADHTGEHVLEHIDRTLRYGVQNQITRTWR